MKAFRSADHLVEAHEAMFGDAGRTVAGYLLKWAPILFAVPIDPLSIRIVIAPIELGPYNRHEGYVKPGAEHFMLLNRNLAKFSNNSISLKEGFCVEDFVVHELTHIRQRQLLIENSGRRGWSQNRGVHRDRGWFAAISEASVPYLGIRVPAASWPSKKSVRTDGRILKVDRPEVLSEPDMTHWPTSIRQLAAVGDPRVVSMA